MVWVFQVRLTSFWHHLLIREEGIGYCRWPEKWDRATLTEMGRKARALAVSKYSESVILDKFLKAI